MILIKLVHFRYEVGAVILHSALMSGMRVAFPKTQRTWCFDAFPRYLPIGWKFASMLKFYNKPFSPP